MGDYALVIDDEPAIRRMLASMLAAIGWPAVCASSGTEAFRIAEQDRPRVVLTDIVMPDMEGIEIVRRMHRQFPEIPIIVMSGHVVGTRFLGSARILGAVAALTKPFSLGELQAALDSVVKDEGRG